MRRTPELFRQTARLTCRAVVLAATGSRSSLTATVSGTSDARKSQVEHVDPPEDTAWTQDYYRIILRHRIQEQVHVDRTVRVHRASQR